MVETMGKVSVIKMQKTTINLIDNIKVITKPSYWFLSLPKWSEFSAHLHIRTLIGSAFHLIVNIFICSVTFFETVRSFRNGGTFGQNVFKVIFTTYQLVGVVGHVYYLFQQVAVERFLQSFQKLENNIAAMKTCKRNDWRDHFKVTKAMAFFNWKLLLILPSFFTILKYVDSNALGERIFLFEFNDKWPALTRPLFLVLHLIACIYVTNIYLLIDYVPIYVYCHEAYLLGLLKGAFIRTFDIVRQRRLATGNQTIVNDFNEIWANYEQLRALNEQSAHTLGGAKLLAHCLNFTLACCASYAAIKNVTNIDFFWFICASSAAFFTFRSMCSFVMMSKVKQSSDEMVNTFARLLSTNIELLDEREERVAKSILYRIQANNLSVNVLNLYQADSSVILPLLSFAMSFILLLLGTN